MKNKQKNTGAVSRIIFPFEKIKVNFSLEINFFATKKNVGSTGNNRDSRSRRDGQKRNTGQKVNEGEIIICFRRSFKCGTNTYLGRTGNIHAKISGKVFFQKRRLNGTKRTFVCVA